jgi:sugar transferase (PEP-CTERM/EpsH1 system associated)
VVLSRVPYPLEKGDKLRAFHQIKDLSKKHEIFLFALNDAELHPEAIATLSRYCKKIQIVNLSKWRIVLQLLLGFITNKPFQVHYFHNRKAQKIFDKFLAQIQPDRIYCQLLRTAEYVKNIHHINKTIDYQDAFAKGMEKRMNTAPWYSRFVYSWEYQRLRHYENLAYHYFDKHIIISEQDRAFITHENNETIAVIANGVDMDYYHPMDAIKTYDLVFTGNMSYPPNIDCAVFIAKKVMPIIWQINPEIKLLISGTSPAKEVKNLANNNITITGWVDDMRLSFAKAHLFVAPMQIGTGLQNKLLEAMSMKIPCITSSLANAALKAIPNEHVIIANTPQEIANAIIQLLPDTELQKQLTESAFKFVKQNYSWQANNSALEKIICSS